jgi:tetratricopeptide (TPR) repeat protein
VKKFPREPDFQQLLSLVLLKNDLTAESIQVARSLLRIHPEMIEAYPVLGEAYRRQGKAANAAGYWERYLAKRPASIRAQLALVELYNTLGNKAKLRKTADAIWYLKKDKTLSDLIEEAAALPATKSYVAEKKNLLPIIRRVLQEQVGNLTAG